METIISTLIGITIGGIITYFVSKKFYKKTEKVKSFQPFVRFITSILSDIDPEVKEQLQVSYANHPIEKMYQIEFVIANTGDLPITNIIEPLTLDIPDKGQILDVNIVHIEPKERNIQYEIFQNNDNSQSVSFKFSLLNASEYFVVKLLIKGEIPYTKEDKENDEFDFFLNNMYSSVLTKYSFKITAPDLPPVLKTSRLPFYYETDYPMKNTGIDWGSIAGIFVLVFVFLSLSYLLYSLNDISNGYYLLHFKSFFNDFNLLKFTIIVGWVLDLLFLILIFVVGFQEFPDFKKEPKPKFKLPKKLRNDFGYRNWI